MDKDKFRAITIDLEVYKFLMKESSKRSNKENKRISLNEVLREKLGIKIDKI